MTLQRFLVIALLVFLLGIGVLYAGVNRVPFRHGGNHEMHKSSLTFAAAATGSSLNAAVALPDRTDGLK
ncbi:MAG TPA: hypothetical protein PKA28_14820 [Methylomusa anaerophila]|uniref:Uncharacterized protein n=1 Tax=Methylomusa anaerophila TaxID=1930071 RepID=A0A348AEI4_9FIRM|nr:hypothetical protein [Methylomusa anaerophila]BBB89482.1 hypothetical protein MAMMFC1_00115 [Methylomusa anaerophila]HML89713.1 hypothetical protein [Methylomusa anaerophila]